MASEIARSPAAWERIAKDWLVEVIERTPLEEIERLPLAWMATEATPLIAEILGQLSDPGATRDLRLPPAARERVASLSGDRADPARSIPGELAALQSLLVEALGREIHGRDRGEFARSVSRLAEVFGAVQTAALGGLGNQASGQPAARANAPTAPVEQIQDSASLHEWLRIMIAESRPTARPFAVAQVEIEGTERIEASYGKEAADRMVTAVAAILDAQKDPRDRAFRSGDAQLVIVSENADAAELGEFASRFVGTVEDSQASGGPRVSVVIGLASFPAHGDRAEALLDAAEQAAWTAAAAGDPFALATGSLQNP
ncbi:hypothetical protein BH10ACT11_BH10ACT11_20760 [soil metagenome]